MLLAGGSAVRLWVVLGVTAVIEAGAFAAFGRDAESGPAEANDPKLLLTMGQ